MLVRRSIFLQNDYPGCNVSAGEKLQDGLSGLYFNHTAFCQPSGLSRLWRLHRNHTASVLLNWLTKQSARRGTQKLGHPFQAVSVFSSACDPPRDAVSCMALFNYGRSPEQLARGAPHWLETTRDWHIKRQHIGMEPIYKALITAALQSSPPSHFPSAEET